MLTLTVSKPRPSFVPSVCSCDMVRIISGHLAGCFTCGVPNSQSSSLAINFAVHLRRHFTPTIKICTFVHTAQTHTSASLKSASNLQLWSLQPKSSNCQRSRSALSFTFSNSALYTPSHSLLSFTITPNQLDGNPSWSAVFNGCACASSS